MNDQEKVSALLKGKRVSSEKEKNVFDLLLHLEWVGVFSTEKKEICFAVNKKV